MYTIQQLIKHFPAKCIQLVAWGMASALFKTILFVLLHDFVIALAASEKNAWYLLAAVGAMCMSFFLEIVFYKQAAKLFQRLVLQLKTTLLTNLRNTSLVHFEMIGKVKLYATISQNISTVSTVSHFLPISLLQGSLALVFMFSYVSIKSPLVGLLFLIWLVGVALLIISQISPRLVKARKSEEMTINNYLLSLTNLLKGFKEIHVNHDKKRAVLKGHSIHARQAAKLLGIKIVADRHRIIYTDSTFLGLLAFLVFIIGGIASSSYQQIILPIVILMLMLMRSVYYILMTFEVWNTVDNAIQSLLSLIEDLKPSHQAHLPIVDRPKVTFQQHIELKKVKFNYPTQKNKTPYGIGPINLKIKKGECVFIVGGNGSGKSTLLKVLTQLYYPQSGQLYHDGKLIRPHDIPNYHKLFSSIFTDFHLFDKLYGLKQVNIDHVNHLLQLFAIDEHVVFDGEKFHYSQLSTGQKKRLAMLHVFLENRPIYIFDEVAADQDPSYRKFFYEVVLNDLKQMKKTVIAVSHDDHYFHVADRVLEMVDGQLVPYSTSQASQ